MIFEILIGFLIVVSFVFLFLFKDKIGGKRMAIIMKVMAVTLFILVNIRSFWNDNFIWIINGGTYNKNFYKTHDYFHSILRWGMMISYIVLPCAVFLKNRTLKNIAVYFCLPFSVLALFFYNDFLNYFITDSGRAIYVAEPLRHIEFCLEMILCILLPLMIRFIDKHKFNVKDKKEWFYFFGMLPLIILTVIPVTVPQSLLGFSSKFMKPFTAPHFIWLAIIALVFIGLYFGFRFTKYETRFTLCLFLSLYLFLHYNQIYLMDFNMKRLPFQLCNLGAYLILIAMLIRKQPFFDFVLIANVPGAMIALCMPDVSEGMLSYWNIHFYIEHMWVFLIPLLAVSLRIFARPGKHAITHFFVGFTAYFAICAFGGILANCILYKPFNSFFNRVNYFYIFDDTVLKVLPFLNFTKNLPITINGYTFYPLYMLLIYTLFSVFCLIFYYIYKQLCIVGDNHFKLRQMRIELRCKQGRYKKYIPKTEYELEDLNA